MKVFGQLERAQLENLAADPTGTDLVQGRTWFNTTSNEVKYYNGSTVEVISGAVDPTEPSLLQNVGLQCSVAASALTIALKQADGSTDPTAAAPSRIAFRSPTLTSGAYNVRERTSALSLVISSGSTLGHSNNAEEYIYVYAGDDSGTMRLCVSSTLQPDGAVVTTVAEGGAGAADSATDLYSDAVYSNIPIRLIAKLRSQQTTAGTWALVPELVSLHESPRYTLGTSQVFTASGTWTRPEGCKAVKVTVVGAGGAGGGSASTGAGEYSCGAGGGGGGTAIKFITLGLGASETVTVGSGGTGVSAGSGNSGGSSSFGSHCSASGGSGGTASTANSGARAATGAAQGSGSGGDVNIQGGPGSNGWSSGAATLTNGGQGGGTTHGEGGGEITRISGNQNGAVGRNYGGGGGGSATGPSAGPGTGGAGADGLVIVEEFY